MKVFFVNNLIMGQETRMNSREILANNVYRLRKAAGFTREGLSLALGVENSYISKLERMNMNPTLDKLERIVQYFNIGIKDLFII